jgi:hypothetical protein
VADDEPQWSQRWEYDVFFWNDPPALRPGERADLAMREMLAEKGDAGWELVGVTEGRSRFYTFFFKRPLREY